MSENRLKPLPLGEHSFRDIINNNKLYIDKTGEILKLLSSKGKYFFLSRPRRFGKSLLLSTLEEIFSGNKELFKELYIYDKIEWRKYPVISLSMNKLVYTEGLKAFKESLFDQLKDIYKTFNLEPENEDYILAFKKLIQEAGKNEKAVLLVDEYDKPITEYIEDTEKAGEMRLIMKNFFEIIKASDEYLHFTFITGVSRFSKVSVFSALNNLNDITMDEKYSRLTGIDGEQLSNYFRDRIQIIAKEQDISETDLKEQLKNWYNGYSWDGKNFLYNPYSLLLFFDKKVIDNYWFQSGTPTFLIKLLKNNDTDIIDLDRLIVSKDDFSSFEPDNINIEALLFQTGYLTIKQIIEPLSPFREYVLSYPNLEVRESFLTNILIEFSESRKNNQILISRLIRALQQKEFETFFENIREVFYRIPSVIFMSDKEAYYQTIIYLILTLIGVRINTEVWTNKGRIDAVVETENDIFVFEFKMSSANQAIRQIEAKNYYEKYLNRKKQVLLIGVSFDMQKRNIRDYIVNKA